MRDALALRLEVNSSHSRSSRHSSLRPPTLSMLVVAAAKTLMEAKKTFRRQQTQNLYSILLLRMMFVKKYK